jgi:hypothetical protein
VAELEDQLLRTLADPGPVARPLPAARRAA